MLHTLLIVVHVLICIVLTIVVLLQSSKGGGLAGAFGGAGGAPQQILGSRGMTTLLHKVTIYCAVGFFCTSFLLFMTEDTGTVATRNVVGEAAQKGDLNVPITENPLELPEAVEETPAPASSNEASEESTGDDGGGD